MKCLAAISSCYDFEKNGNNDALRHTWLPDLEKFGVDYRFFFGSGQGAESVRLKDDCVLLPYVEDGYGTLTYKTRASLGWALNHDYDYVFRCFPDTYVRVDRLMECGFEKHDYHGDFRGDPSTNEVTHQRAQNYASGGPGYWLSKRAYPLLIDAPVLGVWRDEITPYAEDLWCGNILGRSPTPLKYFDDTKRFINKGSHYYPTPANEVISSHLSCPEKYSVDFMYAAHKPWACRG